MDLGRDNDEPATTPRQFDLDPDTIPHARERFVDWLEAQGVDDRDVFDARLVVGELLANAREYGDGSAIRLHWRAIPPSVHVVVSNRVAETVPPEPGTWEIPDSLIAQGRGLGIVRELTDRVDMVVGSGWVDIHVGFDQLLPEPQESTSTC